MKCLNPNIINNKDACVDYNKETEECDREINKCCWQERHLNMNVNWEEAMKKNHSGVNQ